MTSAVSFLFSANLQGADTLEEYKQRVATFLLQSFSS
nr:hypothetical protein [Bacillus cereus]